MAFIVEVIVNVNTGEHISTKIIGETDESPMPELISYLAERWREQNPDNESA